VTLNADGSFTYTATTGFSGTDTFTNASTTTVKVNYATVNGTATKGSDALCRRHTGPATAIRD